MPEPLVALDPCDKARMPSQILGLRNHHHFTPPKTLQNPSLDGHEIKLAPVQIPNFRLLFAGFRHFCVKNLSTVRAARD
jgi:hypothetical protein